MRRRFPGLTLVETLMSACLVILIFFSVIYIYPSAMFAQQKGRDMMTAASCAQREIERAQAMPWAAVATGSRTEVVTEDARSFVVVTEVTEQGRTKTVSVTAAPREARPGIRVTVRFQICLYDFTNP